MSSFDSLVQIVEKLRSEEGCPWDKAQTPESMRPYLLEEAHEALDAIDSGANDGIKKELGDLLFQIVMIAQMKREAGDFDIQDVAAAISEKMISRHPHVFDPDHVPTGDEGSVAAWEARKAKERGRSGSMLDGVPRGLPSLLRAHRVGEKVSRVGFAWPSIQGVYDKIDEEMEELREAIAAGDPEAIQAEYGDLLLSVSSLGRFLEADPETSLRLANRRFEARFRDVEKLAEELELSLHDLDLDGLEELWGQAKALEAERLANEEKT